MSQPSGIEITKAPQRPGRGQTLASLLILTILAGVAVGVLLASHSLNPAVEVFRQLRLASDQGQGAKGPDLASYAPQSLRGAGAAQSYGPEDLYVKINGKADLYLRAGFQRLFAQRFTLGPGPEPWAEALAYHMASPDAAYAVFSSQRRSGGQDLGFTPFAYAVENAVFAAAGDWYLEVVGSVSDPNLVKAMTQLAQVFAAAQAPQAAKAKGPSELGWFPAEGMVPDSLVRQVGAVFGFSGYKGIYTARYQVGPRQVSAYLSKRESAAAAQALADDYAAFVLANGGRAVEVPPDAPPGTRLFELMGDYEAVFTKDAILGGVSGAPDAGAAESLSRRLVEGLP